MARPYAINATALKTTHKAGGRGGESTARVEIYSFIISLSRSSANSDQSDSFIPIRFEPK